LEEKMDIDTLSKGVGLFSAALAALKQAISLLPENAHKADVEAAYERAYRELKIAEAETANKLKYEICRAHFPPEIMLSKDDKIWICPICDNKKDKRAFATSSISKSNLI
jgi:hypothetical protein